MNEQPNTIDNSARRARLLYGFLVVLLLVFISRLFYLQVIRHDHYRDQALSEHRMKFSVAANRGRIYAFDGDTAVPLVLNENLPTLYADPRNIKDPVSLAEKIATVTGGSVPELKQKLGDSKKAYVVLAKRLSRTQANQIKKMDLNGIGMTDTIYRVYPEGALAAQTLGFVNDEGQGQYGVESYLNKELIGTSGELKAVTDVYGIPLTTNDENVIKDPTDGKDVTLTIDVNLQRFVEEALAKGVKNSKGKSGSAIVMDPHTGEIKAMANVPTFDPAKYRSTADYGAFRNDVVGRAYETGSGVKVFTMSAGINEGVVNKDSTYNDTGSVRVDDRLIENAGGGGGGTRNMTSVIQNSVNTGVVYVLKQLGGGDINQKARHTLHDYFTDRFRFGRVTGVEQVNEPAGVIAEPDTGAGDNIRYANMTFGQGMTVTMVQMTGALSAVVNGGTYYQPHVVYSRRVPGGRSELVKPKVLRKDVIKASTSKDLRLMMRQVVLAGGGNKAKRAGYFVGGKTGTAQVIDENGRYSDSREIGSFQGFVGSSVDDVSYVIMTRVDEPGVPGYAGTVAAAPIFADISNYLIDYYQIPPGE